MVDDQAKEQVVSQLNYLGNHVGIGMRSTVFPLLLYTVKHPRPVNSIL